MLTTTILLGPNEPHFSECLSSVLTISNQIVVVYDPDTTKENNINLLDNPKITGVHHTWTHNWAFARNVALDNIPDKTTWILWVDADDMVPEATQRAIRRAVEGESREGVAGYFMPYTYNRDEFGTPLTRTYRERLLRRDAGWKWKFPVHECLNFEQGQMGWMDEEIIHLGKSIPPDRHKKNIEALQSELKQLISALGTAHHDTLRMHYYLIRELTFESDRSIVDLARSFLDVSQKEMFRADVCLQVGHVFVAHGNHETAHDWFNRASAEMPDLAEPYYQRGVLFYTAEAWEDCITFMERSLEQKARFLEIFPNEAIYTYLPHDYLQIAYWKTGLISEAIDSARIFLESCPKHERVTSNLLFFESLQTKEHNVKLVTKTPLTGGKKGKMGFFVGAHPHEWNRRTVDVSGIHGRETSNALIAEEMAKLGWDVTVFTECQSMEGEFNDVRYLDYRRFHRWCEGNGPDVIFTSGQNWIFDQPVHVELSVLWIHDADLGNEENSPNWYPSSERRKQIDRVFFMSPWQQQNCMSFYDFDKDSQYLTRSGIQRKRFDREGIERDRHRCIYSSSPDRGLQRLLSFWPEILAQVPNATLHVFYGFDNFDASIQYQADPNGAREWMESMLDKLTTLPGVHYYGRVDQKRLAVEFQKSSVWLYPTHFTETMCLTALESMNAGCVPVVSNLAALETTVGEGGIRIGGDPDSDHYREKFISETCQLLTNIEYFREWSGKAIGQASDYWDWATIAGEWDEYLLKQTAVSQVVSDNLSTLLKVCHRTDMIANPPDLYIGQIAFFIAYDEHETTPETLKTGGFSGGIYSFVKLASALSRRNWRVVVYGTLKGEPKEINGVVYKDRRCIEPDSLNNFDVLVADGLFSMPVCKKAKLNILWLLNATPYSNDSIEELAEFKDAIVIASEIAVHQQQGYRNFDSSLFRVLRHGVDRFAIQQALDTHHPKRPRTKLFASGNGGAYSIEFFRRLASLKEIVPDLELTITSCEKDILREVGLENAAWIHHNVKTGEANYLEQLTAHQIWIYPSDRPDTYGIAAREAIACGCLPLVSNWWAMSVSVGMFGEMVAGVPGSKRFWDNYFETLHRLIIDDGFFDESHTRMEGFDLNYASWDQVASEWETLFKTELIQSSILSPK